MVTTRGHALVGRRVSSSTLAFTVKAEVLVLLQHETPHLLLLLAAQPRSSGAEEDIKSSFPHITMLCVKPRIINSQS